MSTLFESYKPFSGVYDEFFGSSQCFLPHVENLCRSLNAIGLDEIGLRQTLAEQSFERGGITFPLPTEDVDLEKIIPFDLIPRAISEREWLQTKKGLEQRVKALNLFLNDIYTKKQILKDKVIPQEVVESSPGYIPEMQGITPPGGVYVHIAGIDLVRDPSGNFLVLEDNLRCPSGVSFLLENRQIMKQTMPQIFSKVKINPVSNYPMQLRNTLTSLVKGDPNHAFCAILTPGPYNSAYYEHTFLAKNMGAELVQSQDLFISNDHLYVKTTNGAQRIDVLYRRINDDFLDPEFFRPDSLIGVKGIVEVYAKGNIILANAIGNGVADDKAMYPFVPSIIRYYLSEEPILSQVETYYCGKPDELSFTLQNIQQLVVKNVYESGGHGMLFGPKASQKECDKFKKIITKNPRHYIAQPVVELSTCPTWIDGKICPRRVDLRPFILSGASTWTLPGGFTRVAHTEGSYVVNSCQGGGSKDTWVIEEMSE